MMIGDSYVIAEIAPDLTGTDGKISSADVYALSKSGRKKRSELAIAIDRQGVNIYNIRFSRLVTSYVISPQASFTCPPCSLRYKPIKAQPAQRYTYCSVTAPKPRLLGFLEDCPANSSLTSISTFSIDPKTSSPILFLDAISIPPKDEQTFQSHVVFAVHADGIISYFSQDLSERWAEPTRIFVPTSHGDRERHLEHACCMSRRQAAKSLLRNREDISNGNNPNDAVSESAVLFVLTSDPSLQRTAESRLQVSLFEFVPYQPTDGTHHVQVRLSELVSQGLPVPIQLAGSRSDFALYASSGSLYQVTEIGIGSYDLTSFAPRLAHFLPSSGGNIGSCLRLSSTLLAVAVDDKIDLLSLPFGSLQDSRNMSGSRSDSNKNQSGKQNTSSAQHVVGLLSHSEQHGLLIALEGRKLLATPVSVASRSLLSRKRTRDGLLIASLGRGTRVQNHENQQLVLNASFEPSSETRLGHHERLHWEQQKKSWDKMFEEGHISAFEASLIRELKGNSLSKASMQTASYALSKIFAVQDETNGSNGNDQESTRSIRVVCWPEELSDLLLNHGLLAQDRIESSFKQFRILPSYSELAPGALIKALARWDASLSILKTVIASPVILRPMELATALATATSVTQTPDDAGGTKLLTSGDTQATPYADNELQLSNGAKALDHSGPTGNALETAKQIVYLVVEKLCLFPLGTLAQALRKTFSKPHLRSLADMLRLEIARDGWLSSYDEFGNDMDQSMVDDRLSHISHLLNGILDALGPAGWMTGSSSTDELTYAADTISYMKAEISAALEGIEEATYLQHVLGEVMLCGKDTLYERQYQQKYSQDSGMRPDAIRPSNAAFRDPVSGELPLGLKLKPKIPLTKVGAGGEIIKRSKRDLGRLKSRLVGKYSFEQIKI